MIDRVYDQFFWYIFFLIFLSVPIFIIYIFLKKKKLITEEQNEKIIWEEDCFTVFGNFYISSVFCKIRIFETFISISTYRKVIIPFKDILKYEIVNYPRDGGIKLVHQKLIGLF